MKLIEINWQPTDRQLRQFGFICMVALPLVGWLWGANTQLVLRLGAAGALVAGVSWLIPVAIKPIFLLLTVLTLPIGFLLSELILILIYYGVFCPIGLVFWLRRRDALQRKFDRNAESYWQPKPKPTSSASYYRQS